MRGIFLALLMTATQPNCEELAKAGQLYNAACCYALAGNKDAAFTTLDEVLRRGWPNTKQLRDDPDLISLRTDPRWPSVIARSEANWNTKFGDDNRELWTIVDADQADRNDPAVDLSAAIERDHQRLRRVKEILAARSMKTMMDFFMAALVMQHGNMPDDYLEARDLALTAWEIDPKNDRAHWLAAAALDRYLWCVGKPQIYGTQFHQVDGKWTIDPIDEKAVTDAERAQWSVPPLADARKRADGMNRKQP